MHVGESETRHLGAYRIESLLGQGGMGEVFLAWDKRLRRHVVIKRIRADLPIDRRHRTRFRREALAVARLSHPSIVQLFDLLEREEGDCLVMEWVEGKGLHEVIAQGALTVSYALDLAIEIAGGLAEAHSKGLIHRDLKPENIRVTSSGHAKILDFGLARMLWSAEGGAGSSATAQLTQNGALLGTVHAMSPEQASGRPVDHRSDLFALGGLLYEMLSGRPPFQGANVLDTLRKITGEEPSSLAALRPELPTELVELVERLLAKEPNARLQNAPMVVEALQRLQNASPEVSEVPTSPPPKATAGSPTTAGGVDDLPTGEFLLPLQTEETSSVATVVRTLFFTELLQRSELLRRHGEEPMAQAFKHHDERLRQLVKQHGGQEVDHGDRRLALFEAPADALACALAHQNALVELSSSLTVDLRARSAVHLGEVLLRSSSTAEIGRGLPPLEVEGLEKAVASQLLDLAAPRQILTTRGAFDLARRTTGQAEDQRWLAHGRYLLADAEEPLEIFEVGLKDLAPLKPPPDSAQAKRVMTPSEELMLGWRPAAEQTIPRRPLWILKERIGEGGFGEVWLAQHKSGERRVFKFCFEVEKLRALKREVTLFRVLKEALGHREDIARVLDWYFEEAPYFLEAEYTEGGSLVQWAAEQGGLAEVPLKTRLELVAQIADALTAAHSVGILHKDIKPDNVLITTDHEARPRARLTDFGIGLLTDRSHLDAQGVTALGFTATMSPTESSNAGTLGYLAPELLAGHPATVQADIYSLGVLLYQMVVGDFSRFLASGWQRDVDDGLLAEDLALAVDGRAEHRLRSTLEIAERLRNLEARRAQRREQKAAQERAARATKRRRLLATVAVVSTVFLAVVSIFAFQAVRAREDALRSQADAERGRGQAEQLIEFMLGDLHDSLEQVGRLDLLLQVARSAQEYFDDLEEWEVDSEATYQRGLTLLNIGDVLLEQGEPEAAFNSFNTTHKLFAGAAERNPSDARWAVGLVKSQLRVGAGQKGIGATEAARRTLTQALEEAQTLAALRPTDRDRQFDVCRAFFELSNLEQDVGFIDLAIDAGREALARSEDLTQVPGKVPWRHWRLLLDARVHFAFMMAEQNELQIALRHYLQARDLAEELIASDPTNGAWPRALPPIQYQIGFLQFRRNDLDAALESFEVVSSAYENLSKSDPTRERWKAELAESLRWMGMVYIAQEAYPQALKIYQRALGYAEELVESSERSDWFSYLAVVHQSIGLTHWKTKDYAAALAAHLEAHKWRERLVTATPGDPAPLHALSWNQLQIGELYSLLHREAEAREEWRQALKVIAPIDQGSDLYFRMVHAQILLRLGRLEEAKPMVEGLLALGWDNAEFLQAVRETGLGHLLS